MRGFAVLAAISGALAVILGAFGAHALRGSIDDNALQIWHTAVEYQFWHTFVLLAIALAPISATRTLRAGACLFAIGIVLFSGSLFALALGAPHGVGVITPVGGLALIAGWLLLAVALWRHAK